MLSKLAWCIRLPAQLLKTSLVTRIVMKQPLFIILLLCILPLATASFTPVIRDSYFNHSAACSGNNYDCGTNTDGIISMNDEINITIQTDDGLGTYWCATFINGSSAKTTTCIIRQGFNTTICDSIINDITVNKSEWFNSTTTNMMGIGWNGLHSIPRFASNSPTRTYQINTGIVNSREYVFVEYICNITVKEQIQSATIRIDTIDKKGVICNGNNYESAVYTTNGIRTLFSAQLCAEGTFCDTTLLTNVTSNQNISRNVCTPGCNDNMQDGAETEADYGGIICGNCTEKGKKSDAYYSFAKEIQISAHGSLNNENRFNASAYCASGQDVGAGSFASIGIIIIITVVTLLFLLLIIGFFVIFFTVLVIAYFRRKQGKKPEVI